MSGVAGASIGLAAGQQVNIAAVQARVDGTTTCRGCTTDFIGFGFSSSVQEPLPKDFIAADDTVIRGIAVNGTIQVPTYNAIAGNVVDETLTWPAGASASPVTNSLAPSVTGTAQVGQTLTAVPGTWAGGPTPTYTYQWTVAITPAPFVQVLGTASTYVCKTADVGKAITLRVTGRNPVNTLTVAATPTAAVIA